MFKPPKSSYTTDMVSKIFLNFRYMTAGKHIGKVLIKVRPEEKDFNAVPEMLLKEAKPRFACCGEKVYLICGKFGKLKLENRIIFFFLCQTERARQGCIQNFPN